MAKTDNILERAHGDGLRRPSAGMTVPDGYFADFAEKMASQLPYRPEAEAPDDVEAMRPRTLWQSMRPYIYLAAMFAGIWLMLQMFTMISGTSKLPPLDSNPLLAEAFSDDDFMFDYFYDDMSSYEIADEMMDDDYVLDYDFTVETSDIEP